MPENATVVVAAEMGPKIAAFTCHHPGGIAAVINTAARYDPVMRTQAALALTSAGLDAGQVIGALHGVCS
jgi:hypothetical protein